MNKYKEAYDASLKHSGVKGMRWGVRKRVSAEIGSIRSKSNHAKKLKDTSKLSDDELKKLTNRVRLENDLKRLSTGRKATGVMSTKRSSRKEYLERSKLSDDDLKKRVARLQLEDGLRQQVGTSTKKQKDIGMRAIKSVFNVSVYTVIGKQSLTSAIAREVKNQVEITATAMKDKQKSTGFTPGSIATTVVNARSEAKNKKKP